MSGKLSGVFVVFCYKDFFEKTRFLVGILCGWFGLVGGNDSMLGDSCGVYRGNGEIGEIGAEES